MSKCSRPSIVAIHHDTGYLRKLADETQRDGRFHWAGGYTQANKVLVGHPGQPATAAMVSLKPGAKVAAPIDEVRLLAQLWPKMSLVVLGEERNLALLLEAIEAGAIGYLSHRPHAKELLDAVDSAIRGGSVIHGRTLRLLVDHLRSAQNSARERPRLGRTETRILAHLSTGATQKETAEALGLAYQTVRNLCQRIYRQLKVTSEREAVLWYSRHRRSSTNS